MIEAISLHKRFGPVQALRDVSFGVAQGEVAAFLGPNGAGKTTCMRILTGFLPASAGRAVVAGFDVAAQSRAARAALGYLPESVPLPGDMRVREYLDFRARIKRVAVRQRRRRIATVVERCGLETMKARLVGRLSKGYRQRVGLADALVADPPVLIFDEPTVGLDPNQTVEVRRLIAELGAERTVLLSTHILSEAEAISGRIIIIHHGRILIEDTPAGLQRRVHAHRPIRVEIAGAAAPACRAALAELTGVRRVAAADDAGSHGGEWHGLAVHHDTETDLREAIFALARERGWRLRELHREDLSLEQIFRAVTGADAGKGGADA
ncbi:MAG: ATP-binding cassette domain-containing protein [Planctomycetes bacterium]|nr:ATP-binding cassette domain-containing protein [Planctomycetota bacterium]